MYKFAKEKNEGKLILNNMLTLDLQYKCVNELLINISTD